MTGWKQIGDITHRFRVDKANPRIEVELIEVKASLGGGVNVISLEMAKKLKEGRGLNGSRKGGDWYYFGEMDGELHLLRVAIPKPVPEVF